MKVSFDIGGVISKYPDQFRTLINCLQHSNNIEVFIITDMHDRQQSISMLEMNKIQIKQENLYSADFSTYGEACKAVLLKELEIDIHFDDFPAYIAEGCPVRLLVLPDINRPYYDDEWKTPTDIGDFGRRKRCEAYRNSVLK